jgi:translation elongation factor EF-1beta
MNTIKMGLTAVIMGASLLYGTDSINEQIQAIQKVSVQERAELMNKLKIQIASMNEEERADAISALRTEMGGKYMNSGTSPIGQRLQQIQSIQQGSLIQRSGDTLTRTRR